MSTSVDERVVSMKFDNKQFESNAKVSMTTLERLKEKLNFTGAAKGLENVNSAAKNINMAGLGNAVETVRVKFSALEVMAVTALANITNSAVNAGKRMVSALTVDPIMSGFKEYETQINAVQTILANTQSKGTTLDQVNAALDELNLYADKTIYNFTEMTRNIGTFTAAGVELDTAVTAIKGIANLAAVSGSTSQQASSAMYQLSQALAAGTIKLMDWNSVVTAGMGGEIFQDALKETARVHGVAIDQMIKDEGTFRETLQKGWLTSEILTETLSKFTMTTEDLTDAQIESNKQMLLAKGYSEEQVEAIFKLGQTATDAATKVKTFSQLWDTLKEAAQSGWTQTWEIIVGDFEEAKEFLTRISDAVGAVIEKMSESRNALLEDALGSKWNKLTERINEAGIETDKFTEKLREVAKENNIKGFDTIVEECGSLEKAFASGKLSGDLITKTLKSLAGANDKAATSTGDMTKKLEYFQDVVDRVWGGEFKTAPVRYQMLTEAGYDYKVVQDLVNKTVDGHRLTLEDLSDVQLKSIGYTDEEIKAIQKLADEAEKADSPLNKLISDIEKPSGRTLLIESLFNIMKGIGTVATTAGNAMRKVFEPIKADQIYGTVEALNKFTEKLANLPAETTWDLYRAFRGLFTVISLIAKVVNGAFTIAIEIAKAVLEYFHVDIIDLAATIGDAIVAFDEWIKKNNIIKAVVKATIPIIEKAIGVFGELFNKLNNTGILTKIADAFSGIGAAISSWTEGFTSSENPGTYIIESITKGITEGIPSVIFAAKEIGKNILDAIRNFLGLGSSSASSASSDFTEIGSAAMEDIGEGMKSASGFLTITPFTDIGKGIMEKLGSGIEAGKTFLETAWENVRGFFNGIIEYVKGINLGNVFAVAFSGGIFFTIKKLTDVLDTLASPLESLDGLFDTIKDFFTGLGESIAQLNKAKAFKERTEGIKNIAISIGILAASVFLLAKLQKDDMLWPAVGAVAALAGIILAVSIITTLIDKKFGGEKLNTSTITIGAMALFIMSLAKAMSIIAGTLKDMESLDGTFLLRNIIILIGIAFALIKTVKVIEKLALNDPKNALGFAAIGVVMVAIAHSLKTLINSLITLSNLDENSFDQGIKYLGGIMAGLAVLIKMSKGVSGTAFLSILAIPIALKIFVGVIKDITKLDLGTVGAHLDSLFFVFGMFAALMIATRLAGANAAKAGSAILMIAISVNLIILALKMFEGLDPTALQNSMSAIATILKMFAAIIVVSLLAGKNAAEAGKMLMRISLAILVVAAAIVLLSFRGNELDNAVNAVLKIGTLFAILIAVSKLSVRASKGTKSSVIPLIIGLAVLLAAVAALSVIEQRNGNLEEVCKSLSLVMAMFAIMIASTSLAKKVSGTIIIMGLVVAGLAGILFAMSELGVTSAMGNAIALSVLLLAFTAALAVISKLNVQIVPAIKGALALGALMTILTGVMLGIGYLVSILPNSEEVLDKTISILTKVGTAVGGFFGGIVGGLVGGVGYGITAFLPAIGESLKTFFDNISGIDSSTTESVKNLVEAILLITGAEILQSLANNIFGTSTFSSFSEGLVLFGETLVSYGNAVEGLNADSVEKSAIAGKALAELNKYIPNSGGKLAEWIGDNTWDTFKEGLTEFGMTLKRYSKIVKDVDGDSVEKSAIAGKALAELNKNIPNSGGKLAEWIGDNTWDTFKEGLTEFGMSLKRYSKIVKDVDADSVENSAIAGETLAALANKLPNSGGKLAEWFGDNDFESFGNSLLKFGKKFVEYSEVVTDVDLDVVDSTIVAATSLAELEATLPDKKWFSDGMVLDDFGKVLSKFGGYFYDYYSEIESIEPIAFGYTTVELGRLIDVLKGVDGLDTDAVASFGTSLKKVGEAGIDKFISAFSGAVDKVANAFEDLLKNSLARIRNQSTRFFVSGCAFASDLLKGIKSKRDDFIRAGAYLVDGFVKGIDDNIYKAEAKAAAMARAAAIAAEKELEIGSPSKVFYRIGNYTGLGFVNALTGYADKAYKASSGVVDSAIEGMSYAISKAADIIDSDMDMTPTIRPVIDLTDVENGNKRLSSIFGSSRSITVDSARIKASKLAGDINSAKADTAANQNGPSFSFTQNNYSPKALSQIDIYRQTKNQFSAMKGVLSKA